MVGKGSVLRMGSFLCVKPPGYQNKVTHECRLGMWGIGEGARGETVTCACVCMSQSQKPGTDTLHTDPSLPFYLASVSCEDRNYNCPWVWEG